jgi:hypothetical protein
MLKYCKMQAPVTESVATMLSVMSAHAPEGSAMALQERAF